MALFCSENISGIVLASILLRKNHRQRQSAVPLAQGSGASAARARNQRRFHARLHDASTKSELLYPFYADDGSNYRRISAPAHLSQLKSISRYLRFVRWAVALHDLHIF